MRHRSFALKGMLAAAVAAGLLLTPAFVAAQDENWTAPRTSGARRTSRVSGISAP